MKNFLNIIIGLLFTANILFAVGIYKYVDESEHITWGQFKKDVIENEFLQKLNINK